MNKIIKRAVLAAVLAFLAGEQLLAIINCSSKDSTIVFTGPNGYLSNATPISNFNGKINCNPAVGTFVQGSIINFTKGQFQTQNGQNGIFTGAIDSTSSSGLTLTGSDRLYINDGNCSQGVNISGTGNAVYIGTSYTGAISLSSSSTTFSLASKCPISNSIALNGGTVTLASSITFDAGFGFTGGGTVLLNNNTLTLHQFTLPTLITISGPGAIILIGQITLSAILTINNSLGPVQITGPAEIVYTSSTGALSVTGSGRTFIRNITITNISTAATNGITVSSSSELEFEDCVLELAANLTFSSGRIFFTKRNLINCSSNAYVLVASGAGTIIFVGNGELLYEDLGGTSTMPLTVAASGQIVYDPLAIVQNTVVATGAAGITGPAGVAGTAEASSSISASTTLTRDYNLTASSTFTFHNATPATVITITLNFSNFALYFNYSTSVYMTVNTNTHAVFNNVFIYGWDNALCSFGTGASLTFSTNTYMNFTKDTQLLSTDMPWLITGNAWIDGNGHMFTLANSSNLVVSNTAATILVFRNMVFKPLSATSYQQTTATGTTTFENMDIYVSTNGFTMATGYYTIRGTVRFLAAGQTSSASVNTVTLSTAGTLTIESGAKMIIGPGVTFAYSPVVTGQSNAQAKSHLVMADLSSTLELDNGTISSQSPGMGLYTGRFSIKNFCSLVVTSTGAFTAAEIGPNVITEICPASILQVTGALSLV